jgi:hypothetical protein
MSKAVIITVRASTRPDASGDRAGPQAARRRGEGARPGRGGGQRDGRSEPPLAPEPRIAVDARHPVGQPRVVGAHGRTGGALRHPLHIRLQLAIVAHAHGHVHVQPVERPVREYPGCRAAAAPARGFTNSGPCSRRAPRAKLVPCQPVGGVYAAETLPASRIAFMAASILVPHFGHPGAAAAT